MSRRLLVYLALLIIGIFQIPVVKKYTLESANSLKNSFSSFVTSVKETYNEYIEQKIHLKICLKKINS